MKAEIISIGTEITNGRNLDTNAQWLSQRLAEMGIPVGFHTSVADDFDDNVAVFRTACDRADVVLTTGGLGPTQDDLTREVLAKVAGVELVEDAESLKFIQHLFESRGRQMPERNRVQAMLPQGAEVIPNPIGSAPGIWMKIDRAVVACMPGVPSEMHRMFAEMVRSRLLALGVGGGVQIERKINVFGGGESTIEEKLFDLTRRGHVPEVGITASDATISLRIIARAENEAAAWKQIEPVEQTIRERLGHLVFGVGDEQLQHAVVKLLSETKTTLATAESMTAGLVAARIAQIPGASNWFRGGMVTYDNGIKADVLGVSKELLDRYTAISEEVVRDMAIQARARFNTDLAVSVVGVAGPDPLADDQPVGLTFAAVASGEGVHAQRFIWPGTRTEIQSRAAKMALNMVRLQLRKMVD